MKYFAIWGLVAAAALGTIFIAVAALAGFAYGIVAFAS